jgi:hypothetical protein
VHIIRKIRELFANETNNLRIDELRHTIRWSVKKELNNSRYGC